jgi:hypothetical protein
MGWWSISDKENITIGDTVLDLARRFLIDFSQEYQEDLERKPTLAELQYALNLVLKVNLDDNILQNFEELEVKSVEIKTSKRPKRVKPTPGDIFAFKINEELFGFGRLVANVSIGMVAEIFHYFSKQPILDLSKTNEWVIQPLILDTYSLFERKIEGDWRIIGHLDDNNLDEKFKDIKFVYGMPPKQLMAVSIDDSEQPISQQESASFRRYSPCGDYDVKQLLQEIIE